MATAIVCDCCKAAKTKVTKHVMTENGIHPPVVRPRQDGLVPSNAIDICESCATALRFKWGALAQMGGAS